MKQYLKQLLLVVPLCLLLTGCDLYDDGSDETALPTGTYSAVQPGSLPSNSWKEPDFSQSGQTVKRVMEYEGEIPLSDPTVRYKYYLPMIDLAGQQAFGCNQEIEDRYGSLIRKSLEAMKRYETPVLEKLTYSSFTIKNVLTLRIDRQDTNGETSQAFYTVHAQSGDAVTLYDLFEAAKIDRNPEQVLNQAVVKLFQSRFGSLDGADSAYTTALTRTQSELARLATNRMHLTEAGRLLVTLTVYDPNGGTTQEDLLLP